MRKFTLLIASLFITIGAMAQTSRYDGQYVTLTNVQSNGTTHTLYINDGALAISSSSATDLGENAIFKCEQRENGKFTFYNEANELYVIWRGNGNGFNGDAGTLADYNATYCDWTIKNGNFGNNYGYTNRLVGTRSNGDAGSIIISTGGAFNAWGDADCTRTDFSTSFRIETVDPLYPESGKAYIIRSQQVSGTKFVLQKSDAGVLQMADDIEAANATDSHIFICSEVDVENNKFSFVNAANGKFMLFYGVSNTNPLAPDGGSANGFSSAYNSLNQGECDLAITPYMNNTTFSISGIRRNNNGTYGYATMAINPNKSMNANSDIGSNTFNGNWSTMFTFEEVEYANKPTLNNIGESSLINFEGSIATFSAPFATVVPEGITAYYATTKGENYISLTAIDAEYAVPANTGILLVGNKDAGEIVMVPATSETAANIESNLLGHSAGAEKVLTTSDYILTGGAQGAGFYPCSGGTLSKNKSYLDGTNGTSLAAAFYGFGFGEGTTAIEEVKTENGEVKTIYDLTGRRVEKITEAGIYIVNGKKVLVK